MKKVLAVLAVAVILAGCSKPIPQKSVNKHSGVWLSYSEVNAMLDGDFKAEFNTFIKNCQDLKITDLYIHVRAFRDALYKSKLFPQNEKSLKYDFDVLEWVLDISHQNGIKVHAWINPYRISLSDTTTNSFKATNYYSKYKAFVYEYKHTERNTAEVLFVDICNKCVVIPFAFRTL